MTMHYKFQQPSPIYSGRYLRFRSSTVCWLLQLLHRDRAHSANCTVTLRFHSSVLGLVVDMPVGVQTTGLWSDSAENCGVPQVHSSCQRVDVPVVRVVQILRCKCGGDSRLPQLQVVEKFVDIPHVFLDKVVEMPVGVQQQVLGLWLQKTADKVWTSLRLCSDVSRSGRCHRFSSSPVLVDTQFAQRLVTVGYVAAMRDQGQDFLEHLCQSQWGPVVPESPGVLLPGDSAPGLPISS